MVYEAVTGADFFQKAGFGEQVSCGCCQLFIDVYLVDLKQTICSVSGLLHGSNKVTACTFRGYLWEPTPMHRMFNLKEGSS